MAGAVKSVVPTVKVAPKKSQFDGKAKPRAEVPDPCSPDVKPPNRGDAVSYPERSIRKVGR